MKSRLLDIWERLRTSFWLVPSLMALAAVGLSAGTVALDAGPVGQQLAGSVGWLWSGGPDGARSLLSTVASSMITVAGTVFSITIAALTLASSQFGPRLLRNFTRDLGNQIVLGTFVATFLYCLLVLRTVRSQAEGGFVPYLSVTCGVLLAVASLGVLIYFIDHISSSIQAESLVASIGTELKRDIVRLCPLEQSNLEPDAVAMPDGDGCDIRVETSGYMQTVDRDDLVAIAEEGDLLIRALRRPGDFVSRGDVLLHIWAAEKLKDDQLARLRGAFSFGSRRTPTQDVRYGVRQLTEIATRALSPGINDPFTAMGCANWLGDALAEMARRATPPGVRRGSRGRPRLLEEPVSFAELASLSFDPLRVYGADSSLVVIHVLQLLTRLLAQMDRPEPRAALSREAEQIVATAREALRTSDDVQRVQEVLDQVRSTTLPIIPRDSAR